MYTFFVLQKESAASKTAVHLNCITDNQGLSEFVWRVFHFIARAGEITLYCGSTISHSNIFIELVAKAHVLKPDQLEMTFYLISHLPHSVCGESFCCYFDQHPNSTTLFLFITAGTHNQREVRGSSLPY